MTAVIANVHIHDANGLPNDDTVNTFTFFNSGTLIEPGALILNVRPFLESFYNGPTVGTSIGTYLGQELNRVVDGNFIEWYQLAPAGSIVPRTPLGGPLSRTTFTLGGSGGQPSMPRECAVVLSLSAPHAGIAEDVPGGPVGPKGDTHPAARHRGRVYLGPLNNSAVGSGSNGPGVKNTFRDLIVTQAALLMTNCNTIAGGTTGWGIWSRKDAAIYPVTHGWVDDAFDTQRRRGIGSTARSTF